MIIYRPLTPGQALADAGSMQDLGAGHS